MAGLFGSSPQPAPTPAPAPKVEDPSIQQAAEAARVAAAQSGGRASTQLTGGQGDTSSPSLLTQALKQQLGA